MHLGGCTVIVHGGVEAGVIGKGEAAVEPCHNVVDALVKISPSLVEIGILSWHRRER